MAALPGPPGIANGSLRVAIDNQCPPHAPVLVGGITTPAVVVGSKRRLDCIAGFAEENITINELGAEFSITMR
jgi:hypothetical protein